MQVRVGGSEILGAAQSIAGELAPVVGILLICSVAQPELW